MKPKQTVRELVEKLLQNHFKPCDCLNCRKGGRIDIFLKELTELVELERKEYSCGHKNGDVMSACCDTCHYVDIYNEAINRIKEMMK